MPLHDPQHQAQPSRPIETDRQLEAIRRGLADADAGRFASEAQVARVFAKYEAY